jgi:hypothetical protein
MELQEEQQANVASVFCDHPSTLIKAWARICKRLRSPGMDSLQSIAGLVKRLQIRALDIG